MDCFIQQSQPSDRENSRLAMEKSRVRAVGILLIFGSILVLMATWDLPENRPPQLK
jgi:hypothetical protein